MAYQDMVGHPEIFDRALLRLRRARSYRFSQAHGGDHDFLFRETGGQLLERLEGVRRSFHRILILGSKGVDLGRIATAERMVVTADLSGDVIRGGVRVEAIVADEELLPFAPQSFDLVLSNLSLHWVNDLPGALVQIRQALKPDGLFLGSLFGRGTLAELRTSLMEVEASGSGGAGPRVSPFADVRDAGQLLQRAGFAMPVADAETTTATYGGIMPLLTDLRRMGEANALKERPRLPLRPIMLAEAEQYYRDKWGNGDGRLPASFEILHLAGWAPHPDQPQPLKPGSAKARLADALGVGEAKLKG